MTRNSREPTGRRALAARISAQFDQALSQAAETMDSFELGWDDTGPEGADDGADGDLLPLEFQLADLERAVDTMLLERDRFMYGDDGANPAAGGAETPLVGTGRQKGNP